MAHNQLTVVAVYGHNDGSSAIPSILKSMQELEGSQGLLISPVKPENLPEQIQWSHCYPLNYHQYSWFVMYSLWAYIETDYCLIVQDDGWVLNGKNWRSEYYDYDYVGAPVQAAMIDDLYYPLWGWLDKPGKVYQVQNGGFSLRSKRFLQAPAKYGIMHETFNVEPFCNEDVQLTCFLRDKLEDVGMKYAPSDLAKHFAIEYLGPGFHDDLDFSKLLGQHCPNRKLKDTNHIYVVKPLEEVTTYFREMEFLRYLQDSGYSVEYHA